MSVLSHRNWVNTFSQCSSSQGRPPLTPLLCCTFRPPGAARAVNSSSCRPSEGRELCSPHPLQSLPRQTGPATPGEWGPRAASPLPTGACFGRLTAPFPVSQLKGTGFGIKLGVQTQQRVWTIAPTRHRTPSGTPCPGDHVRRKPTWPPREAVARGAGSVSLGGSPHPVPTVFCKRSLLW